MQSQIASHSTTTSDMMIMMIKWWLCWLCYDDDDAEAAEYVGVSFHSTQSEFRNGVCVDTFRPWRIVMGQRGFFSPVTWHVKGGEHLVGGQLHSITIKWMQEMVEIRCDADAGMRQCRSISGVKTLHFTVALTCSLTPQGVQITDCALTEVWQPLYRPAVPTDSHTKYQTSLLTTPKISSFDLNKTFSLGP